MYPNCTLQGRNNIIFQKGPSGTMLYLNMDKKLTTRQEYDEAKAIVETLIVEATAKGMLEPEMDNEYTRQIAELGKQMAQYEDEYMNIMLGIDSDLILEYA